jgi:uncharacterized protein (TIGR03067 family)
MANTSARVHPTDRLIRSARADVLTKRHRRAQTEPPYPDPDLGTGLAMHGRRDTWRSIELDGGKLMPTKLLGIGLMLAGVLMASSTVRADEAAVEKDLKKLEGEWTIKNENGGEVTYKFKGDKLEVEAPSRSYKMTVKIDPTAKPERTLDFHIDEGPDDAKGKTSKAIYKFDGDDTLIFCMRPEGERPAKYEQVGYEQIVSTPKRKKS